jgi:hypothetical protein
VNAHDQSGQVVGWSEPSRGETSRPTLRPTTASLDADVTVRREQALDSRPGTGSLHTAIEATAEATKPSELSM